MGVAIFRADASQKTGAGHVMRCLTLANALAEEGLSCVFATCRESEAIVRDISVFPVMWLSDEELLSAAALRARRPEGCDLLIVDHYGIASDYESALRGWAGRIVVIDDLADRKHDCDLLLDQTLGRLPSEYENFVPQHCNILTGSTFALLRPEFAAARATAMRRHSSGGSVRRILVSLGATDPADVTKSVLAVLAQVAPEVDVDVVYGVAPPAALQPGSGSSDWQGKVCNHFRTSRMAELATEADLAIGAAGISTWERCCLGLPAIVLVLAENQRGVAAALKSCGGAVVTDLAGLPEAVQALMRNPEARVKIAVQASLMCDGLGTRRVLSEILPIAARNGKAVTLRPASMADAEVMLGWQREPLVRAFSRTTRIPERSEHLAWLEARLRDPDCLLAIIESDHAPVGAVRLDPPNAAGRREVSIYLGSAHHGQGIASAALAQLRRLVPEDSLEAHVLPGNEASAKLFSAAGYCCLKPGLYVSSPPRILQ